MAGDKIIFKLELPVYVLYPKLAKSYNHTLVNGNESKNQCKLWVGTRPAIAAVLKLPKIQKNNRMVNLSTIDVVDGNQASAEFKISSDS